MSAARFGLRALRQQPAFRSSLQTNLRFTQRRWQTSAAADAAAPVKEETTLGKFWNSPVGPKTVHFWAPIMKWGLVLAGAADFARPASQLSITQNAALTATGAIWTRWCFVIKPRNVFLASVNFCLALVGATQVTRVLLYQQEQKREGLTGVAKDIATEEGKAAESVVKTVQKST